MWWFIRAYFKHFSRFKAVDLEIQKRVSFEQQSRQQIRDYQLQRFNQLWEFSCTHVPYYRALKASHHLPSHFSALENISQQVPILEKSEIQKAPELFRADRPSTGFWTGTSGSTGTPMKCYWGQDAYLESQRDKYYCQSLFGLSVWDKTANLWGYSRFWGRSLEQKIEYLKIRISEKIRNKIAFPVDRIDRDKLRKWYRQLNQKKIIFLYALPNLAYLLARANEDQPPPSCLKLVMVGGEPLFDYQQELMEKVFGCPVAIEYGTIEAGLIAASYPDSKLHVCERGTLLETLPSSDGLFELVLTNLRNPDFPLIRYRIGDFVTDPLSFPEQGTATLSPVIGRVRDVFISPSGTIINGVELSEFFRTFPEIIQYQAIQESLHKVFIKVVCSPVLSEANRHKINTKFANILGDQVEVQVKQVDQIKSTAANKHRFIISKVAMEHLNHLRPE